MSELKDKELEAGKAGRGVSALTRLLGGRVIEGNCINIMDNIPTKSIDFILCDLPYGTTQNKWDSVIPLAELWKHYLRIAKDDAAIALTAQGIFTSKIIQSAEEIFKYKIVWEKSKATNFLNAKRQPLRKHEDVCVFYRKQPTYNPQMINGKPYNKGVRKDQQIGSYGNIVPVENKSNGKRYPTDIFYCRTAESEGKVWHSTQKPVRLGRYLIKTFTNPGDIVLDNACGSGSFLVAAEKEGRKPIGIDISKQFCEIAEKRLEQEARQPTLQL